MDKKYICYCGLYCENCIVKARVTPAATALYAEMKKAGYEGFINYIPDGESFWRFLKNTVENGACTCCKSGGGNPGCEVRICARAKNVEACAFCEIIPVISSPPFSTAIIPFYAATTPF